ncbi:hypothetical protein QYF36_000195 [Acer negundo]|nr:hypothetical protein QYF36_000195 [Acer negundo]
MSGDVERDVKMDKKMVCNAKLVLEKRREDFSKNWSDDDDSSMSSDFEDGIWQIAGYGKFEGDCSKKDFSGLKRASFGLILGRNIVSLMIKLLILGFDIGPAKTISSLSDESFKSPAHKLIQVTKSGSLENAMRSPGNVDLLISISV